MNPINWYSKSGCCLNRALCDTDLKFGLAWLGLAWLSLARLSSARLSSARLWPGLAWPRLGLTWLGSALAWPGLTWPDLTWPGLAWLGLAWLGLAGLGWFEASTLKCHETHVTRYGNSPLTFATLCALPCGMRCCFHMTRESRWALPKPEFYQNLSI